LKSEHIAVEIKNLLSRFPPGLSDLDLRFSMMDKVEGYAQVLTLAEPPLERITAPDVSAEFSRVANDSMAELVAKYPDRFVAAAASLPMNNIDAALVELDRAVNDLGMKGVQVYSSVNGKPLDSPEFLPLYQKLCEYDIPLWIHPYRGDDVPDYPTETKSIFRINGLYGWPFETTVAMARLVDSGIMEKYSNLKVITHHCGGIMPYLSGRIEEIGISKMTPGLGTVHPLTKEPIEYLKNFYGDTAIFGPVSAMMCGFEFFGAEHMLFGTDMPFSAGGISGAEACIKYIEQMPVSAEDKALIYEGNARRILRLK